MMYIRCYEREMMNEGDNSPMDIAVNLGQKTQFIRDVSRSCDIDYQNVWLSYKRFDTIKLDNTKKG